MVMRFKETTSASQNNFSLDSESLGGSVEPAKISGKFSGFNSNDYEGTTIGSGLSLAKKIGMTTLLATVLLPNLLPSQEKNAGSPGNQKSGKIKTPDETYKELETAILKLTSEQRN